MSGKFTVNKFAVGKLASGNFAYRQKAVYTKGAGPVRICTGQCTVEGSVQGGGGRYLGCKDGNFSYWAKFPEASFPTANLFTVNFPRTINRYYQNVKILQTNLTQALNIN